jgi:hypothetical protein
VLASVDYRAATALEPIVVIRPLAPRLVNRFVRDFVRVVAQKLT